ncbi:MAG: hypothetical protein GX754_09750 [Clostridiaceae bacterium]|nr:hypothetical protein [Clostridiaceae bacterium]
MTRVTRGGGIVTRKRCAVFEKDAQFCKVRIVFTRYERFFYKGCVSITGDE